MLSFYDQTKLYFAREVQSRVECKIVFGYIAEYSTLFSQYLGLHRPSHDIQDSSLNYANIFTVRVFIIVMKTDPVYMSFSLNIYVTTTTTLYTFLVLSINLCSHIV